MLNAGAGTGAVAPAPVTRVTRGKQAPGQTAQRQARIPVPSTEAAKPVLAKLSNHASVDCPRLIELSAKLNGVEVRCLLDSGATHSFVS